MNTYLKIITIDNNGELYDIKEMKVEYTSRKKFYAVSQWAINEAIKNSLKGMKVELKAIKGE